MSSVVPIRIPDQTDDELMAVAEEVSPYIACDEVTAVCLSITKRYYRPYMRDAWVFEFGIISPEEYLNERVRMFVRRDPKWKYLPESSSLFKAACVALGRRPYRKEHITKSLWLQKAFRLRLRQSGTGPAAYSVVAQLIEKVTG